MDALLKEKLIHRLQSLLWRIAGLAAVALLGFIADPENLNLFKLAPGVIVVIGLVVNEITKFINNNLPEIRAAKVAD